jgi:hypothetical protein
MLTPYINISDVASSFIAIMPRLSSLDFSPT